MKKEDIDILLTDDSENTQKKNTSNKSIEQDFEKNRKNRLEKYNKNSSYMKKNNNKIYIALFCLIVFLFGLFYFSNKIINSKQEVYQTSENNNTSINNKENFKYEAVPLNKKDSIVKQYDLPKAQVPDMTNLNKEINNYLNNSLNGNTNSISNKKYPISLPNIANSKIGDKINKESLSKLGFEIQDSNGNQYATSLNTFNVFGQPGASITMLYPNGLLSNVQIDYENTNLTNLLKHLIKIYSLNEKEFICNDSIPEYSSCSLTAYSNTANIKLQIMVFPKINKASITYNKI